MIKCNNTIKNLLTQEKLPSCTKTLTPIHTLSCLALCTLCFLSLLFIACSPAANTPVVINDEAQQLTTLIQNSNSDASYTISVNRDNPETPVIVIDDISNTALGSPLSFTIAINQEVGILTTDPMQLDILNLPIISPYKNTWLVKTTFGSAEAVDLNVEIRIDGAAVTDWFTHNTLSTYIDANFAGQTASLSLNEDSRISLSTLTNVRNGTGSIQFKLPPGFEADPSQISLTDPDGADIGEVSIVLDSSQFIIKETDRPANTKTYSIADIPLAALDSFTPSIHINITDETSSTEVSGLSYEVNESNQITITGLVNTIGTDKEYILTISPAQGIFTTPNNTDITITFTDPLGFIPGFGTFSSNNTFTVTNEGDASTTEYTLMVPFGGAPVRDWLTPTEFYTYFGTPTFAGHYSMLLFNGIILTIDGGNIYNVPNGEIVLTTNLPTGYLLTNSTTDPDGLGIAEITNGDAGSIIISEVDNPNNSEEYPVHINLAAYSSPVEASHVTAIFNEVTANPTNIVIRGTDIIISGFVNIAGSTGSGSVSITSPTTGEFTIDQNPFSLGFTDPEGTAFEETAIGSVNISSDGYAVSHNIIVSFSTLLELTITSNNILGSPFTIISNGTIMVMNLGVCEILPSPDIEIVGRPFGTVTGFPSYFDREIDTLTTDSSPVYQINRILHIEDSNGNVLDELFTVTVVNFPNCDASAINGLGTDAASAYDIDSATKLELVSHLVNSDNSNYGSKFYKLTADIDLGLADLPWSETASGESGKGFPPIGVNESTSFQGTFNCNSNTISNLYINRENNSNIGLFGYTSNARIQNCSLVDVKVSGYRYVGGLAGYINSTSRIENSYTTGSVSGNVYVGGLVGNMYNSTATNSYTTVSVSAANLVGGLVGFVTSFSRIENSYATGSVFGTNNNVGGLVGNHLGFSTITNSYATGDVSGPRTVGLFIGLNGASLPRVSYTGVTDSYYNNEAVLSIVTEDADTGTTSTNRIDAQGVGSDDTSDPATTTAGLTGLSISELQVEQGLSGSTDPYISWDTTIWQFSNDQYPRLINVACANRQYSQDQSIACGSL